MSFFARYRCHGAILMLIVTSISGYHFDVGNITLYEDPARSGSRGSYFGYTVALWSPEKRNSEESWIFIGAPRANSSAYPGVHEPGTVFKCNMRKQCDEWMMGDKNNTRPTSGSWLGGAMNVENKTNPEIVVCASKWTTLKSSDNMPGSCYQAKVIEILHSKRSVGSHLQPLLGHDVERDGKYYYNLGQSGFSIHMFAGATGLEFILGCPGVLEWHGTQIKCETEAGCDVKDPVDPTRATADYFGYAVTSGKYFDDVRMYAAGAPRGECLRGQVLVFDEFTDQDDLEEYALKLSGEHIGEYFGAALASCDIDGDRKDDLLVGAPQWTRVSDEGRVYIFRGSSITEDHSYEFKTRNQIDGTTPRGRFGSTITCLGDTDYDGYADVAVGAPYDGNGAVYIFHGSKNGLTSNPQKIAGPKATRGFGISISEPRDVDNNGYADIAVGAHLSGHVTLIRSKRVVTMTVDMTPNFIGEQLDLEAESFSVSVCSTYGGPHAPKALSVTKEFKIDAMHERAKIEAEGKNWTTYQFSETLKSDTPKLCRNFTIVIVKTVNFDYLNPVKLSVSQRLDETKRNSKIVVNPHNILGTDNFHISDAVSRKRDSARVEYSRDIPFKIDCNNNTCRSNLSIEMTTDLENGTRYVIGSTPSHLRLDVKVKNSGDNAYSAKAYVNIRNFIKIVKKPSTCETYRRNTTDIAIMCEIGNPLPKNKTGNFSIDLDMSAVPIDTTAIKFEGVTATSSEEVSSRGHKTELSISSVREADIGITGKTNVDWCSFMQTQKEERLPNIMFQHTYEIRNDKVTPLRGALLSISIPMYWIHADEKIEIVKLNETVGDLDGNQFHCQSPKESSDMRSLSYDATTMPEWLLGENSSGLTSQLGKKFINIDGKVFGASPDNRTLYINTTNPAVKWKTIDCIIGSFKTAKSEAKVNLTFDLLLHNLTPDIMNEKDIIFFATNGSTKIIEPPRFIQTVNNKPDVIMIGTMFIGSTLEHQVVTWVIVLSVLIGLLFLALLVLGLFKFGFFKRSKKLKLEALIKENENMDPKVVLETTSSTDYLNIT